MMVVACIELDEHVETTGCIVAFHYLGYLSQFFNNHHLLNVIHDKLQPLGLSRSETIISFNAAINRQIPISELPDDDDYNDNDDDEDENESVTTEE